METKVSKKSVFLDGLIKENPVLVLLLGTCPTLGVSIGVKGALGMSIAVIFVLTCSNIVISILKNIIPNKVRIPAYIIVIAGFVSIVQLLVQAYAPSIYEILGVYLPLIVVNCIILGRAEIFASKNSVVNSALDGLSMGIGFTIAIFTMATIREIIGKGTWMEIPVTVNYITPMAIVAMAPGGFFVYGIMIAFVNWITKGKAIKRETMGCAGCVMNGECDPEGSM